LADVNQKETQKQSKSLGCKRGAR